MQLADAAALAAEIEADDRFRVMAVGKFELLDAIVAANPNAYPWAVSAVAIADTTYRAVLRTRADWIEWRDLAPAPEPPPRPAKKREPVAIKSTAAVATEPRPNQSFLF